MRRRIDVPRTQGRTTLTARFSVLRQLRKKLDETQFLARREELLAKGWQLFGLWRDGALVSVASACATPHVSRGATFWIHDLVVDAEKRSGGAGTQMMAALQGYARERGCHRICVHTRHTNDGARRFYSERAGLEDYARVFQRRGDESPS